MQVIYFYRFFFIKTRHAGAVRNEELLDFAPLCCTGKSFLLVGRKGDTAPVLLACDLSPVVSFSCNQSFVPSDVVSGYFFNLA